MIAPASGSRIALTTRPTDLRKRIDGPVSHAPNSFDLAPFSGAIYIFRTRRADRLKLLVRDGTGLTLVPKWLNGKRRVGPKTHDGPLVLSKVQIDTLFEGIHWRAVTVVSVRKPSLL